MGGGNQGRFKNVSVKNVIVFIVFEEVAA